MSDKAGRPAYGPYSVRVGTEEEKGKIFIDAPGWGAMAALPRLIDEETSSVAMATAHFLAASWNMAIGLHRARALAIQFKRYSEAEYYGMLLKFAHAESLRPEGDLDLPASVAVDPDLVRLTPQPAVAAAPVKLDQAPDTIGIICAVLAEYPTKPLSVQARHILDRLAQARLRVLWEDAPRPELPAAEQVSKAISQVVLRGCVCPVGAESTCRSLFCGRRTVGGPAGG